MKKINLWFRAVFGFSQKEIKGFIILIIIMVLLIIAPFLFENFIQKEANYNSEEDNKILFSLQEKAKIEKDKVFEQRKKSYPKLKSDSKNTKKHFVIKNESEQTEEGKPKWNPDKYKKITTPFHINKADTSDFKQIKGIGSKLSARIISYRSKLGGFHSTKQLYEVYGLDSNLIKQNNKLFLEIQKDIINPINLDTSSVKTLIKHPYINYKKAIAIVNYRSQHGKYKSIDDLRKIHLLKEEDIIKLSPYLLFK